MSERKSKRVVAHVVPNHGAIGWKVIYPEERIHFTKASAIRFAQNFAKSHPLGQVKIHGMDGRIQKEYTYGKDPRRTKG